MPVRTDYYTLNCRTENKQETSVIMMPITAEQEVQLDKGRNINIKIESRYISLGASDIYCYGEIDLSKGSNDYDIFKTFDFIDYIHGKGIYIYSNYNYENHTCTSDLQEPRWKETFKPEELSQWAHGFLGKPKRIVLFRTVIR